MYTQFCSFLLTCLACLCVDELALVERDNCGRENNVRHCVFMVANRAVESN